MSAKFISQWLSRLLKLTDWYPSFSEDPTREVMLDYEWTVFDDNLSKHGPSRWSNSNKHAQPHTANLVQTSDISVFFGIATYCISRSKLI